MNTLNIINIILQIGGTLGLSILGMLLVAWYNATTTPSTANFTFRIFWKDNAEAFIWAVFGMVIIITIIAFVPQASDFFKFIGFNIELPINGVGALTLGGFIYDQARKKSRTQK